jgi:hypothetical protein
MFLINLRVIIQRFRFLYFIIADNGTVCTDKQDGRPYGVQMITFTEKVTNLKYELLMGYLDRDMRISRHL